MIGIHRHGVLLDDDSEDLRIRVRAALGAVARAETAQARVSHAHQRHA